MNCPNCDKHIRFDWLQEECIDAGDEFDCPKCRTTLRLIEDEGGYTGAKETYLELAD